MLKKMLTAAALITALVASLATLPARASFVNPCTGAQMWLTASAETRTCIAPGLVRYVAGTPNPWNIQVKRGTIVVQKLTSGSYAYTAGTLSSRKGDTIIITTSSTCSQYGCANGGFFAVGDQL